MSVVVTPTVYEARAREGLEHLGLNVAHDHLDGATQRAAAESWSYSHFLGYLLDGELTERHRKTVTLNLKFARLPMQRDRRGLSPAKSAWWGSQWSVPREKCLVGPRGRVMMVRKVFGFLAPPLPPLIPP